MTASAANTLRHRYLLFYALEHVDFRLAELQSICSLLRIDFDKLEHSPDSPFVFIHLQSPQHAQRIARRSALMRSCFEVWSTGRNWSELERQLDKLPAEIKTPRRMQHASFRLRVHAFGKTISFDEQLQRIRRLDFVGLKGRVDLSCRAEESFHLFEDYDGDSLRRLIFARWLADSDRSSVHSLSLNKRYFIGNTSMDPLLAMLMANQARVCDGSLALDPFVGSGSILVAAARQGALCLGSDRDLTLLRGRGKSTRAGEQGRWRRQDESIRRNFELYGLQRRYIDIVAADITQSPWRLFDGLLDAIVTDPPYGVRASAACDRETPSSPLAIARLYDDMMALSARMLRRGGRLVFWVPVVLAPEGPEFRPPQHPAFRLVANSLQVLSRSTGRRLLTMEKCSDTTTTTTTVNGIGPDVMHFREAYFGPDRTKVAE